MKYHSYYRHVNYAWAHQSPIESYGLENISRWRKVEKESGPYGALIYYGPFWQARIWTENPDYLVSPDFQSNRVWQARTWTGSSVRD